MKRLREQAEQSGGASYAAVEAARNAQPSLYERLGAERLASVSEAFYTRVYAGLGGDEEDDGNKQDDDDNNDKDDGEWFRALFANTTRAEAVRRQQLYLAQEFGGPRGYETARGAAMLLGRHGPYAIGGAAARRWLACMRGALDEVGVDGESRALLDGYFSHMAWYIVHGRALVNGQRLVGYFGRHAEGEV